MKKLSLKLDELEVESFETTGLRRPSGTVHAHETFESECVCDTDGCGPVNSVESCTACGCDTPGYTCEERCWPETQAPVNTKSDAIAVAHAAYHVR